MLARMNVLPEIESAWSWTGLRPAEIVGENDFGNLIVKDVDGRYWRLCPEEPSCRIVAQTRSDLDRLSTDQEFLHEWYMRALVEEARGLLGPLVEGRKYCLKIPATLGGRYSGENLGTITLAELVRVSGHIAEQIKDLPDGAKVRLQITE
jgi:hypothetical protein